MNTPINAKVYKLKLKAVGIIGAIVLVANVALFAFRIITPLLFWMVIIVMAVLVYVGLPKLKKLIPA